MRAALRTVVLALAIGAVVSAACGGGDDESDSQASTTTTAPRFDEDAVRRDRAVCEALADLVIAVRDYPERIEAARYAVVQAANRAYDRHLAAAALAFLTSDVETVEAAAFDLLTCGSKRLERPVFPDARDGAGQ